MTLSAAAQKHIKEVGPAREAAGDKPSASPVYASAGGQSLYDLASLYELFESSVQKFGDNDCLGWREKAADGTVGPFKFETYKKVAEDVSLIASGLVAIGVKPKEKIGVYGANSAEWMKAMQACNRLNLVCVPLYDSLGENAVEYITNHSEAVAVFVSGGKLDALAKALNKIAAGSTHLKSVIYWGTANEATLKGIKDLGKFDLLSLAELTEKGKASPAQPVPPKKEDLATIMYTSGTTGDPKGVMLTHEALLAGVANCNYYADRNKINVTAKDSMLSYLPLAHIFDRVTEEWFLHLGASIGYWQGDVLKLLDDLAQLKPALFIGVPRVFDRIYARVMGGVEKGSFLKRTLFNWGFQRKLYFMKQGRSQAEAAPFFDKIIFSKVAAALGGNVKAIVSGGAPLAPHVEEFLRVCTCSPVVQGYGLTETCASSFIAASDYLPHASTVGPPTPNTEFRLESVPDMNYNALDDKEPKGEVLIRGPAVFSGYYKGKEMTDEVLEKDGWFHTGDIATITPEGGLKIVDRKKNIFKLSQGEYVAVEKVEATYKKNLNVEQIWVYGNSFKSNLVAVVVPSEAFRQHANSALGIAGDMKAVCADPKATEAMLKMLVETGKADKLKGFELVKAVHLEPKTFAIEEDLLTPTFKLKRPQLLKKYQPQVDTLYSTVKE